MAHPRIGVCSWSLAPQGPADLARRVHDLDLAAVQLALVPLVQQPQAWDGVAAVLAEAGIRVASGMLSMVGEDYRTLESIRSTGGVRQDITWFESRRRAEAVAQAAAAAGIGLVTFHAGFLEDRRDHPSRRAMIHRLRELADLFADHGARVALETGQETADTLLDVLDELNRPDVGVNFDPGNMILYGMGDPVDALQALADRVWQIHVKDARPTAVPGTWGTEVPAGTGAVRWEPLLEVASPLAVDFIIEREAGASRDADIAAARDLVVRHVGVKVGR